MFNLWGKIEERGAVAIPVRPGALSSLEWYEVSELYPELVPQQFLGYDVYSDNRLIRNCPFVRVGDAYKFKAIVPGDDTGIDVFVDTRQLVDMLCAKDYLSDDISFFAGALTCSCGIPDCDGIEKQSSHVSEHMVRWDVSRYGHDYELFFERKAYDVGVVMMLHDLCREDSGINYRVGGGYENRELLVGGVGGMLVRHPYYSDIWEKCGFEPIVMECDEGNGSLLGQKMMENLFDESVRQ